MNKLYTKAEIEKAEDNVITGIASTDVIDRQGESIDVAGWDLKNYKKNPVILAFHDHTKPVGRAERIWVDKSGKKPQLMFKAFISEATETSRGMLQLIKDKVINAVSVGFRPLDMDGNRISKQELLEISLVSVPANQDAMLLAYKSLSNAGFDESVMKELGVEPIDERDERIEALENKVAGLEDQVTIAVKGLQYLAPHRSKPETVAKRLELSKVIAKAADKMIVERKAVSSAKIIKRTSEKLIRELKGDL